MKTVWKKVLAKTDEQVIKLPSGSKILDVQVQDNNWCLWFLCNPAAPLEERRIFIHGTGHEVDSRTFSYIGTFQDGAYVWHVFEGDI